ncbi:MAG: cupin domain-containing protein [Ignavibacteriaceae bacterium]|jgi:predicted cupin superfamily sugar epimerase|nr:cupin domain-containing protein [Ignavibacterium sp.]MCC6255488.1 cupin domain-containing protein [Ignavibacteriaceae bacterium]HMN25375.1 cupin domain-containing protein [Ignavibacteriaceae bacterium]HRN25980.1 cupin domain-containing protein [Ignavibacteriaceae bacterium]HRQ55424.1 cupin domain-containing protein [Ignavibacteriaceae bacterium]
MNEKARYYIDKLELKKHPEGGYYREIYRSAEMFSIDPPKKNLKRNVSTSIYFLLDGSQVSKFHRLKSDELWHFYDGSSIKIYVIDESGKLDEITLGRKTEDGEVFQTVIKKNNWFAAEVINKKSFALIGCTVSPGFDFSDFELADVEYLLKNFPDHKRLIQKLT